MDAIWYAADYPSKHSQNQISTFHDINHQSLSGNEWLDLLIVIFILLIPCLIMFWYVNKK